MCGTIKVIMKDHCWSNDGHYSAHSITAVDCTESEVHKWMDKQFTIYMRSYFHTRSQIIEV